MKSYLLRVLQQVLTPKSIICATEMDDREQQFPTFSTFPTNNNLHNITEKSGKSFYQFLIFIERTRGFIVLEVFRESSVDR